MGICQIQSCRTLKEDRNLISTMAGNNNIKSKRIRNRPLIKMLNYLLIILNLGLILSIIFYENTNGSDKAIIAFTLWYLILMVLNFTLALLLKSLKKEYKIFLKIGLGYLVLFLPILFYVAFTDW